MWFFAHIVLENYFLARRYVTILVLNALPVDSIC